MWAQRERERVTQTRGVTVWKLSLESSVRLLVYTCYTSFAWNLQTMSLLLTLPKPKDREFSEDFYHTQRFPWACCMKTYYRVVAY